MYRIFIFAIALSFFFSCNTTQEENATTSTTESKLPNIIMLVGDDQGYPYFGFMGADYIHTPNMDKLAANGVLFTDGYVSDNHCRPSLQTLLTGILPIDFNNRNFAMMDAEIDRRQIPADSVQAFKQNFEI